MSIHTYVYISFVQFEAIFGYMKLVKGSIADNTRTVPAFKITKSRILHSKNSSKLKLQLTKIKCVLTFQILSNLLMPITACWVSNASICLARRKSTFKRRRLIIGVCLLNEFDTVHAT